MNRLFIADLHLQPCPNQSSSYPTKRHFFDQLLTSNPILSEGVDEVYILGDLFEYWLDWSVAEKIYQPHIQALIRLTSRVKVFFLTGNRDFMLSQTDARQLGMQQFEKATLIACQDSQCLYLTHGDQWVSDLSYRCLAKLLGNPMLSGLVCALPINTKLGIATWLRRQFASNQAAYIQHPFQTCQHLSALDTNSDFAVADTVTDVIFGHFHRPGYYRHQQQQSGPNFWQLGDLRRQQNKHQLWAIWQRDRVEVELGKRLQFIELTTSVAC